MVFEQYLGILQQNKYLYSLVLIATFYVISQLAVFISQKIILRITSRTKTDIDDLIVNRTNRPVSLILLLVGLRLALLPLGIKQSVLGIFEHIISSVLILLITYILIVVIGIIIDGWARKVAERTKSALDSDIAHIFHRFSRIFITIVGILFILPIWGIQIGPLLTSLGIAGVAVAFALQNTLGNIFGGVSLILDKSIKVGDKIKLDNETMGTVLDVGLRSTKIKTWDGELVTIPNGKMADSRILNFVQPDPSVRVVIDFGVEYGSDANKVRKVVLETIKKLPGFMKDPEPKVLMIGMGDFALKFKALFWVENFDMKFEIKSLATENVYNALRNNGIEIPFPTRTVYMADKGKK